MAKIFKKFLEAAAGETVLSKNGIVQRNQIGILAGIYDIDTARVAFRVSHYDPYTGRFVSKDPLFFGGGSTNLYFYAINDPINFIDPTGRRPGDEFGNPVDAGSDAIISINPTSTSHNTEFGGYVYRYGNGSYSAADPTSGGACSTSYGPMPATAVANYHTHGADDPGYYGEYFSAMDYISNFFLPGFLGTPSGSVQMNAGGNFYNVRVCPTN